MPELDLSDDEEEPKVYRGAPTEGLHGRLDWRRAKRINSDTGETVTSVEPGVNTTMKLLDHVPEHQENKGHVLATSGSYDLLPKHQSVINGVEDDPLNLPEMRRFSKGELGNPQGKLSQNFKNGNFSKNADVKPKTYPSGSKFENTRLEYQSVINLFECVPEQLCVLPQEREPEFLDIEFTLDTGASVHAIDKLDLPGFCVRESAGSRKKQNFQAAGGKLIPNEGETDVFILGNGQDGICELVACMQIAKVTRPLLSVSKITEGNKLKVLCDHEGAYIMNLQGKVLVKFARNGGLYTAVLKVKNPKFEPFTRPAP